MLLIASNSCSYSLQPYGLCLFSCHGFLKQGSFNWFKPSPRRSSQAKVEPCLWYLSAGWSGLIPLALAWEELIEVLFTWVNRGKVLTSWCLNVPSAMPCPPTPLFTSVTTTADRNEESGIFFVQDLPAGRSYLRKHQEIQVLLRFSSRNHGQLEYKTNTVD